jgi:hypothetical protein
MLRIQQEDVLWKIASQAQKELSERQEPIQKIPVKFLVPFLEKASLEDLDSELIDTWSRLLSSAATNFDPHMVRFCSIPSEISGTEVRFLNLLCRKTKDSRPLSWISAFRSLFPIMKLSIK